MMYFVITQPTAAHPYNNSSRVKTNWMFYLSRNSLLPHFTGPNIFFTGPQRNIPGTIFYYVIDVTHFTVLCDTCTINLPNRLVDIKN